MGVRPLGFQVRRRVGMSMNPLSSRKTMWAPSFRAFFYCRPLVPLPVRDGLLVALDRAAFWHLTNPPARLKNAPQVARVISDAELLPDHGGDALQRPHLVGEAPSEGAGEQQPQELLSLLQGQLAGSARRGLGRQRCIATSLPVLEPPMDGSRGGSNLAGNLPNPFPFLGQLHGTTTTLFQARWGSDGSHVP